MEQGKRAVNRAKCLLQHASYGHVTDESVPKIDAESGKYGTSLISQVRKKTGQSLDLF